MIIDDAAKDRPSVQAGGSLILDLIEGVELREMPNIVTANGITAEVFRPDWELANDRIAHIIHVRLHGNALSAWHCHRLQTDRIFVTDGSLRVVLYDDREGSRSRGKVNELRLSRYRPTLVVIPPGLWHGIQNLAPAESGFINFFDRAYRYDDPDEWRLPPDTQAIPYRFPTGERRSS